MNVQEVLSISKERSKRTKGAIEKVVDNIHKKILYYAKLKKENCQYIIPPLIDDTPLYERDYIIKEVFKKLDSEGYIVTAYQSGQLDICWNEALVSQKLKTDAYMLSNEERKLKKITKKSKKVDELFGFLANPKKVEKDQTLEEQIDTQLEKILKEKESIQKKYKKLLVTKDKC
jgi:hypothetical protein